MMSVLSKWKIALYLLAIFSAGAVSGWVVAAKTAKQKMLASPRPDEISNSFRERVHSKIDLAPDQAKRVDAVIDRSSKEIQAIHGECRMRWMQSLKDRNVQITGLLNPEQQKQFQQMEKDRQKQWEQMEKQRPDWGRHGGKGPPRDWGRRSPRDRSRTNSVSKQGAVGFTNDLPEK
jgi:hypothetical protein